MSDRILERAAWAEINLPKWRRDKDGTWGSALCQLHEDSNASLRFNLGTGGLKCHGCGWTGTITEYAGKTGLPTEGLPVITGPERKTTAAKKEYVYSGLDGRACLRVTRTDKPGGGKTFFQSRWEGGSWVKGKVVPAPLYNARALAAAPAGSLCFVVEGEKAAEHLIQRGLLATTSPEGACKFGQVGRDYLELLLPLGVFVLPDQDANGFKHALQVGERLRKELAVETRFILLPGLEPKGDVADWLVLPRQPEELVRLTSSALGLDEFRVQAGELFPAKPKPQDEPGKVVLTGISGKKAEQILEAMRGANQPLKVFIWQPTGRIADLRESGEVLQVTSPEGLAHLCERRLGLLFFGVSKDGAEFPVDPPEKPLKRILGMPAVDTGLPTVTELLDSPVLAEDGTLVLKAGLHPSGLYLRPGLELPEVPSSPTPEQTAQALQELDRLIADFPLEGEEDRQAWFSYLLTGFAAGRIPRPWPLWNFSAPLQGSGKGLLASLPARIATGRDPGVISVDTSEKDPELRKKLTSLLDSSPARWQILDNLRGHLASGALEAFLTSQTWADRLLGGNKMGSWPIRVALAVTGNNLTLSPDLERRQILVRLLPDTDKPWLRNDFSIKDLLGFVRENRPKLIWCIMVLLQRWASLSFPQSERRLGSFEGWSSAIGGLLECIGVGSDFLATARVLVKEDPWQTLIQLWADSHIGCVQKPASELVRFTEPAGIHLAEGSPAHSLGKRLAKLVGRVFAIESLSGTRLLRLHFETSGKSGFWSLLEVRSRRREIHAETNPRNPGNPGEPYEKGFSEGLETLSKPWGLPLETPSDLIAAPGVYDGNPRVLGGFPEAQERDNQAENEVCRVSGVLLERSATGEHSEVAGKPFSKGVLEHSGDSVTACAVANEVANPASQAIDLADDEEAL